MCCMNFKRFFFIILFALAVILSQAPLYAATHIVTNCSNEGTGSLRQAILDAQFGDEIVFNISTFEPGVGYSKDIFTSGLVTNEVSGASWFRILLKTDIAINKNNILIKGSTQPNTESNNPYGPRIEIVSNPFYSPYPHSAFNLSSSSNCTIE